MKQRFFFLLLSSFLAVSLILSLTGCQAVPIALISAPSTGTTGVAITLDASGSYDPNGDSLHYYWSLSTQPSHSKAILQNERSAQATLTPDVPGYYVVALFVNDGKKDSTTIVQTIYVSGLEFEVPPEDWEKMDDVVPGQKVILDGEGNYQSYGNISFQWSILFKPQESKVELVNDQSSLATFTPDCYGIYIVKLVVSDREHPIRISVIKIMVMEPFAALRYQTDGDTISLSWKTVLPTNTIVRYGIEGTQSEVKLTERVQDHGLTITGLKPHQKYRCRIISEDAYGFQNIADLDSFVTDYKPIATSGQITRAVYSSEQDRVYVVEYDEMELVDLSAQTVTERIALSHVPTNLCYAKDRNSLFITNQNMTFISEWDAAMKVKKQDLFWPPAGKYGVGAYQILYMSPYLYIVDDDEYEMGILDPATAEYHCIEGLSAVEDFILSQDGRELYVICVDAEQGQRWLYHYHNSTGEPTGWRYLERVYLEESNGVIMRTSTNMFWLNDAELLASSHVVQINPLEIVHSFIPDTIVATDADQGFLVGKSGIYSMSDYRKLDDFVIRYPRAVFFDQHGFAYVVDGLDPYLYKYNLREWITHGWE